MGFFYYLSANSVLYAVQAKKPRQSLQNEYAFWTERDRTDAHVPPCSVATADVLKSSFLAFCAGDASAHFQTMGEGHNKMAEINCQDKILLLGGDGGRWLNTPWHWFCCTWKKNSCSCGTRLHCMITVLKTVGRREGREIFLYVLHTELVCSRKEEVKQKKTHACLMLMPNALEKLLKSSAALKWSMLSSYCEA